MTLDHRYPAIADLKRRARRRLPHFVWEFLASGTGDGSATSNSRAAIEAIHLCPAVLRGHPEPQLETTFLGQQYDMPVGIAPVGMSGLIWAGAEPRLAAAARRHNIPYGLSTVAAAAPETVGPHAGGNGWFQLYPPVDPDILHDLLARARNSGFSTLILTVDVPAASRRERQQRSGLLHPPRLTPRIALQCARCPAWSLATLVHGRPRLVTLDPYADTSRSLPGTAHVGYLLRTAPDWEYLDRVREMWAGKLLVKGVLDAEAAVTIRDAGADAVWVSNHGGRQFEAAPSPISVLPAIRAAVGDDYPLVYDGGVAAGTDVLRAMACGADLVMLGRAWHYGIAALGERGVDQVAHILREGLKADMAQLGIGRPGHARSRLI